MPQNAGTQPGTKSPTARAERNGALRHPRAHDYTHLISRWRSLASKTGLRLEKYACAGGCDLFYLSPANSRAGKPAIYFSAGIHGDEAAATEGLFEWVAANASVVRGLDVLIFPCLNPWGLLNNARRDAEGRDLNRCFRDEGVPQIYAQLRLMECRNFDLALALHEDYDARGLYIYEIPSIKPCWGEALIHAAAEWIPPDPRNKIEGRRARNGVIRRPISPDLMPDWPEAFVLHFHNASRVFTVETPSEFHLDDRVAAQVAVISEAVARCLGERESGV